MSESEDDSLAAEQVGPTWEGTPTVDEAPKLKPGETKPVRPQINVPPGLKAAADAIIEAATLNSARVSEEMVHNWICVFGNQKAGNPPVRLASRTGMTLRNKSVEQAAEVLKELARQGLKFRNEEEREKKQVLEQQKALAHLIRIGASIVASLLDSGAYDEIGTAARQRKADEYHYHSGSKVSQEVSERLRLVQLVLKIAPDALKKADNKDKFKEYLKQRLQVT